MRYISASILFALAVFASRGEAAPSGSSGLASLIRTLKQDLSCGCDEPSISSVPVTGTLNVSGLSTVDYVTIGRGVQNYTCSATGTYVSMGALANLYDISCYTRQGGDPSDLPALALKYLPYPFSVIPPTIQHYFVSAPTGATATISPKFALVSSLGSISTTYNKINSTPSPAHATVDIAWLELGAYVNGTKGGLSQDVFRVETAGGQPPASCTTVGTNISVPYSALYYFVS